MADDFRIRFLSVGQGDAIVGLLPGGRRAFVVDVFNADRVLDFLEAEGISEVILFLTHSDRDHTLGAQDLLAELASDHNPARVLGVFFSRDRISSAKGSEYSALVRFVGRTGRRLSRDDARSLNADFNTVLNRIPAFAELFDPVRVLVIHPEKADQDCLVGCLNETAGVLLLECTSADGLCRRVLLTADVQLTGISLILERARSRPVNANIFKYPHHGAWPTAWPGISELGIQRRTMKDFVYAVGPSHVIFSVGPNPYEHIRPEALALLSEYGAELGKLLAVASTEMTDSLRRAPDLPIANSNHADIEVRIHRHSGRIAVECHDALVR